MQNMRKNDLQQVQSESLSNNSLFSFGYCDFPVFGESIKSRMTSKSNNQSSTPTLPTNDVDRGVDRICGVNANLVT